MKDPYSVIVAPVVTEKSLRLARELNQYTFRVSLEATKIDIRRAVEQIFGVKVTKVNTMRAKPKRRRWGRLPEGKTVQWKKAVVTLAPGHKIDIFEGL